VEGNQGRRAQRNLPPEVRGEPLLWTDPYPVSGLPVIRDTFLIKGSKSKKKSGIVSPGPEFGGNPMGPAGEAGKGQYPARTVWLFPPAKKTPASSNVSRMAATP